MHFGEATVIRTVLHNKFTVDYLQKAYRLMSCAEEIMDGIFVLKPLRDFLYVFMHDSVYYH